MRNGSGKTDAGSENFVNLSGRLRPLSTAEWSDAV